MLPVATGSDVVLVSPPVPHFNKGRLLKLGCQWAEARIWAGYGTLCCFLLGIPAPLQQVSGSQVKPFAKFSLVCALLFGFCILIGTFPNPGGQTFSPGLVFNTAVGQRKCAVLHCTVSWCSHLNKRLSWAQPGPESGEPATGPSDVLYFG